MLVAVGVFAFVRAPKADDGFDSPLWANVRAGAAIVFGLFMIAFFSIKAVA